jgi:hypothetical protein
MTTQGSLSPMTERQREFLKSQEFPAGPVARRKIVGYLILLVFFALWLLIPTLLITSLVVIPIAWITNYLIGIKDFSVDQFFEPALLIVYGVVCLCALGDKVRVSLGERKYRRELASRIAADLERGEIVRTHFTVAGVKVFQESEHKAFIFFVHLTNGKILVLYDHDSFDGQGDRSWDDPPTLDVRETLEQCKFPASLLTMWEFSGEKLPLPKKLEIADSPDDWPDDESWCKVSWDRIEQYYAAKAR